MTVENAATALRVIRSYDWRGRIRSFTCGASSIPNDPANTDAKLLLDRIAAGKCEAVDPTLSFAIETRDRIGKLTGYDTNLGFVPLDEQNALFKCVKRQLDEGDVQISAANNTIPTTKSVILSVLLDGGWITGKSAELPWKYRPHDGAAWIDLNVTIANLEERDLFPQILHLLGISSPELALSLMPARFSLLSIQLDTKNLRSFFKGERVAGFSKYAPFEEDLFQQDLVRNGRSAAEGPSIRFLIDHVGQYMIRPLVDIVNGVGRVFHNQFTQTSFVHMTERSLMSRFTVARAFENGARGIGMFPKQRYRFDGLEAHLPTDAAPDNIPDYSLRQYDFRDTIFQLHRLLSCGFPLEAIALGNAFAESLSQAIVEAIVSGDPTALAEVQKRKSHERNLAIIAEAVRHHVDDYLSQSLNKFVRMAKTIYPHRNNYVHKLHSIDHDHWRSVDLQRKAELLLEPMMDHFHGQLLVQHLDGLIVGRVNLNPAANQAAIVAARPA